MPRFVEALVHRQGLHPPGDAEPERVLASEDGHLYVVHDGRWWRLSTGTAGYHSLNFAPSPLHQRLLDVEARLAHILDRLNQTPPSH